MPRLQRKLVHEGDYAAEVEVQLVEADEGWSPYLTLEDAERLDDVRKALRRGDLAEASRSRAPFTSRQCKRDQSPSRISSSLVDSNGVRVNVAPETLRELASGKRGRRK